MTYTFKIAVSCTNDSGSKEMFDLDLVYKNLDYEDVVLLEEKMLEPLQKLNEYAKEKAKGKK